MNYLKDKQILNKLFNQLESCCINADVLEFIVEDNKLINIKCKNH